MQRTKVRMTHPDQPEQPYWANPSAVPVLMASGWQESPEPPKPPKPPKQPAAAPPESAEDRPAETATRAQPARRRVAEPTTSNEE